VTYVPDPFYRYNELKYRWVTEDSWIYSTELPRQPKGEGDDTPWLLRFESIDTVAEVRLNGQVLGRTDSFFQTYTFEVPQGVLDTHGGEPSSADSGGVSLEVEIRPANGEAALRRAQSSYPVPETTFVNTWTNDSGRNFVRKPAFDWGW
jgi:beta-mannosidase